jgi:hypothetical protein
VFRTAAAFLPAAVSGVIHQNPLHLAGRDGEKMHTVIPIHLGAYRADVCFVDQGGRAQGMSAALGFQKDRASDRS